ncbi:MAG TPA: VOC family protein [Aestuariivirgaceae bacterium]|nr:VOC family protein [Aestuariivirgaceae bacterium]
MTSPDTALDAQPNDDGRLFHTRRFAHVNLFVSDYEKASDFYTKVVGLQEVYRQPGAKASFLSNGNTHHDIAVTDVASKYSKQPEPRLFHVAFELENEVELVKGYERAVEAGMEFDDMQDHDIAHALYRRDPDGHTTELYADVIKDWRARRSGVVSKPKPQWHPGLTPPVGEACYDDDPDIQRVDDAMFHVRRVTHATIVARDYLAMFDYYTRVVGMTPLVGDEDGEFAVLGGSLGEPGIGLFRSSATLQPCFHHFGFELASEAELDAAKKRLSTAGVAVEREVDTPVRKSLFLRDPDNFLIQLHITRGAVADELSSMAAEEAIWVI